MPLTTAPRGKNDSPALRSGLPGAVESHDRACTGVSASHNNRMITAARGVLNQLVSDVHVAAQYDPAPLVGDKGSAQKKKIGIGFGLSLVAESSADGVIYSADEVAPHEGGVVPEDIGTRCAYQLLEVIARDTNVKIGAVNVAIHGVVDRSRQARTDVTVFNSVQLDFRIQGTDGATAATLVEGFKRR